jgi:hypothetical protein
MENSNGQTVLAVSRWNEVFETAESRRHRSLLWIAIPVSFNSTGLQRLLDEFDGVKAAALYGCWNALLKIAASAPVRGVLAGHKGESYTSGRLARLSGFPQQLFDELIPWCVSVGWLVTAQPTTGLPDLTERNLTGPNLTQRNGTEQKPDRAVPDWKVSESQESHRPESIKLVELARHFPLLQTLDSIVIEPSGNAIIGSVISPDRIKREEIERADTQFWLAWYRDQLSAKTPMLRSGNAAEFCFVLASVLAAKRCKNVENKLALWISWLKVRECGSISRSDWKTAAERVRKALGLQSESEPLAVATARPAVVPATERPKKSHHEKRRLLREAEAAAQ